MIILTILLSLPIFAHADPELPPPSVPADVYPAEPIDNQPFAEQPVTKIPEGRPWFRDAGEYMSFRTERPVLATDTSTKIITDGKRFDTAVGKRIPLINFGEEGFEKAWTIGIDGGMLASLTRFRRNGSLVFATNTFDGYFGAFISHLNHGWIFMFHTAHLSAHLVDSSPQFLNPTNYSQFWNELIVGKILPDPTLLSSWQLYLQASVGLNNSSTPRAKQPRNSAGFDFGYALSDPDSLAIIFSGDALDPGVQNQKNTYALFLGLGYLSRTQTMHRPFRFGVAHYSGSDYRNQFYNKKQDWTTLLVNAEF